MWVSMTWARGLACGQVSLCGGMAVSHVCHNPGFVHNAFAPLLQKSCQETGNEPRRIFVVAILRRIGVQSARPAADRHPANSQWAPTKAWIVDLTATRHR